MSQEQDFYKLEKNILLLKKEISDLEISEDPSREEKIGKLRAQIAKEWADISSGLTATQIVQMARHPQRPYTLDYIASLAEDFMEMHGDRRFADDPAIVAGLGFYKGKTTAFIGHQKGRSTRERIARNFGQPNPEGYRKAIRVMKTAEKFAFPIVTLIDTPGAYPGIGAEERGQAEAIAFNLREIASLRVPVVIGIIGEGGSGGALAVGVGDTVYNV
jgi:acetyl-CoA carboxylase carboxyl transferase subunit alpha